MNRPPAAVTAHEKDALRPSSLRAGVLWAGTGHAIYLACQYGMLMAIAKLGTQADVGMFVLALAVTAPVIIMSQMQLRQLHVTDGPGEAAFGDYLTLRLVTTALALLAVAVVVLVAGYDRRMVAVTAAIALAKGFESVSDIAHGTLQREERMDVVARSLALKGICSLAVLVAVLAVARDLTIAVAAMAAVWGLVMIGYDLPAARRSSSNPDTRLVWRPAFARRLLRNGLPLAVTSGLVSLSGNLPRYFLDSFGGKDAVALFAVAATPLTVLGLANMAVSQATLPRAAQYFQTGCNSALVKLSGSIVALQVCAAALVAIVFALAGEWIMVLLFAREYASAGPIAALMAAGVALGGLGAYGSTILLAGRRFHLHLWNISVVVAVQLPICYVLIRSAGVWGAGWSEVIRYSVSAVFLAVGGYIVHKRTLETWARAAGSTSYPPSLSEA